MNPESYFSFEEQALISIYDHSRRAGLITELETMRGYLEPEDDDIRTLTDSTLEKLAAMSDETFEALDFEPVTDEDGE